MGGRLCPPEVCKGLRGRPRTSASRRAAALLTGKDAPTAKPTASRKRITQDMTAHVPSPKVRELQMLVQTSSCRAMSCTRSRPLVSAIRPHATMPRALPMSVTVLP